MKFVNATPHVITVRVDVGPDITIPPSGVVARVNTKEDPVGTTGPIPLVRRTWGNITALPELEEGWYMIVSSPVLDAAKLQNHPLLRWMVVPDFGPTAIRDEKGMVVAVKRFIVA